MARFKWPEDIEDAGSTDLGDTEAVLEERLGNVESYVEHLRALVPFYEKLGDCLESSDIGAVAENAIDRGRTLDAVERLLKEAEPLLAIAQAERDRQIQRWADDHELEPVDSRDTVLALPAVHALIDIAKKLEPLDKRISDWEPIDWMLGDIIDLSSTGIYERMAEHDEIGSIDDPIESATIVIEFISELATTAYIETAIAELEGADDEDEEEEPDEDETA